jgi:hypothetical protein
VKAMRPGCGFPDDDRSFAVDSPAAAVPNAVPVRVYNSPGRL